MEPLPNTVKQALGNSRQSAVGPHPDADLLAAFQEGALTAREQESLLAHFAACAHCREVARLALPAPESGQQVIVPVPAASVWRRWLSWAAVATATVVLGSVGVIYQAQHRGSEQAKLSATRSDQSIPVIASGTPAAPAPSAAAKAAKKTASTSDQAKAVARPLEPAAAAPLDQQAAALQPKVEPTPGLPGTGLGMKTGTAFSSGEVGMKVPGFLAGNNRAAADASTVERGPQGAPPAGAIGATRSGASDEVGSRASAAPSANGGHQSDSLTRSQAMKMKAMGAATEAQRQTASQPHSPSGFDSAAPARAQWRISPAGELQRGFAGSDWQTVLAAAATRFHALAVIGNNVWAGGSEANLFHSTDGGASWTRVPLPTPRPRQGQAPEPGPEQKSAAPTITRITWDDALKGTVGADNVAWTTADGGRTWSQQ